MAEEPPDRSVRLRATDMPCSSGGDGGEVAVDGRGPFHQNKVGNPETSVAEWKQQIGRGLEDTCHKKLHIYPPFWWFDVRPLCSQSLSPSFSGTAVTVAMDINDLHPQDDHGHRFFIWHEWLQVFLYSPSMIAPG